MKNTGINRQRSTDIITKTVLFLSLFWSLEFFTSSLLFCPSSSLFLSLPLPAKLAVLPVSSTRVDG